MRITDKIYFAAYYDSAGKEIEMLVENFDFRYQGDYLAYQIQASAVYSSNIEGNSIDLNSFMNYQFSNKGVKKQKDIKEIEDLIAAYQLAQTSELTEKNFLKAHKILAKELLIAPFRGKYRNDKVGVFGQSGLVYLAIEPEYVAAEMKMFFEDIRTLLTLPMNVAEVFYHASLIHLKFVHIHPFRDGNGRAARLLEKWFLSQKLDNLYWQIPSEKYYKEHQAEYYQHINLGINFYELNYEKCIPFLAMLPQSLK